MTDVTEIKYPDVRRTEYEQRNGKTGCDQRPEDEECMHQNSTKRPQLRAKTLGRKCDHT